MKPSRPFTTTNGTWSDGWRSKKVDFFLPSAQFPRAQRTENSAELKNKFDERKLFEVFLLLLLLSKPNSFMSPTVTKRHWHEKKSLRTLSSCYERSQELNVLGKNEFPSWWTILGVGTNALSNEKGNFAFINHCDGSWMWTARCERLRKTCRRLQSASREDLTPVDKRHSDTQITLPHEFICMRLAFDNAGRRGENGLWRGGARENPTRELCQQSAANSALCYIVLLQSIYCKVI